MSLLKDAIEMAGDAIVDEAGDVYLGKLIKEGRDVLDKEKKDLPEGAPEAISEALDVLESNKQPFLRLGKVGFARLLSHWEDEDEAEARRQYLATEATFQERRAAMHAAGDAVANEAKERQEAWDNVVAVLKQVGQVGLKFLVRVVIASL